MNGMTIGKKLGLGFAVTVSLAVAIGVVAIYALRGVVASKDRVLSVNAELVAGARRLEGLVERKSSKGRGFLLEGDERFVEEIAQTRSDLLAVVRDLQARGSTGEERALIGSIETVEREHQQALDGVIDLRRKGMRIEEVAQAFDARVLPKRDALTSQVAAFVELEERLLREARIEANRTVDRAISVVVTIAVIAAILAVLIALLLTRALGRQIGTSVGQVQSSSAELQAAANQQATGAKQQATAMNEITTTITELLATSRQIAESAQRVAGIAEQTAAGARTGTGTVDRGQESIASIRKQVDLIVGHMLELGKKSQQIGVVLDIVAELAEQTNILAINATIEAAGAGEGGKRFAVVAEEIRKLADRVGGSTKDVRTMIEDVRGAVNATVMVTEGGAKAVDTGSRLFAEIASAFRDIAGRVVTATEAAREIELSTKQQTSAVEQVNMAIANVAQASRETEASSLQTLQTASQLAALSKDLLRLIQPEARA